jgi:serine phosphatase RsbU (regulator of sigma subunit)
MDIGIIRVENEKNDFSKSKFKINFAGAKIPLVYIINNELFEIKGTRKSIGGKQKEVTRKYENNELLINESCNLYLVTDGFADIHSSNNEKFGPKRVKELILGNSKKTMDVQKFSFENEIKNFITTEKIRDDVTIICLKLN